MCIKNFSPFFFFQKNANKTQWNILIVRGWTLDFKQNKNCFSFRFLFYLLWIATLCNCKITNCSVNWLVNGSLNKTKKKSKIHRTHKWHMHHFGYVWNAKNNFYVWLHDLLRMIGIIERRVFSTVKDVHIYHQIYRLMNLSRPFIIHRFTASNSEIIIISSLKIN